MKYRAMDGYEIEAKDNRELAEKLWKSMFIPDKDIETWMVNSAKRAMIFNNSVIRTDSIDHHIEDLIKTGFVSPAVECMETRLKKNAGHAKRRGLCYFVRMACLYSMRKIWTRHNLRDRQRRESEPQNGPRRRHNAATDQRMAATIRRIAAIAFRPSGTRIN